MAWQSVTPAAKNLQLPPATYDEPEMVKDYPYRQIIGSPTYLMTETRSESRWIVSKLSQHLEKPGSARVKVTKGVLQYRRGTEDLC